MKHIPGRVYLYQEVFEPRQGRTDDDKMKLISR